MYKDLYLKTKVTCVFFLSILDPNERKLNIVSTFVLEIKVTVIYKIVVFFYSYTWSFLTIVSTCTTCTSRELRLVCKIYPFKFLSRHFTLVKLCIYQSLQFYAPHPKKRGGGILFCLFLVSMLWPSVFAQYHLTPLLDSYQIGTERAAREEMIPIDFKVM